MQYTCPVCQKTLVVVKRQEAAHRPFCSLRCKLLDLDKWFNEEVRVSAPPTQPTDEAPDGRALPPSDTAL